MKITWYGQSAFGLEADGGSVFIDPFGDMSAAAAHGTRFDYPPIEGATADLLLVTHEHFDHNGVEAIGGEPTVIRSTAGTHESPLGEVIGVASEHDEVAGTQRGPNTIFSFELDGVRICHFGDFGQSALRPEQAAALSGVELLIVPVGDGPTIGAAGAKAIVQELKPRWVLPMHYRTERISFLEPIDAFLELFGEVERLETPAFDVGELREVDGPLAVVPAAP
ncbi:MAG: MBL fold metallo-hydrolase [Solirubrobacteraceae bacterium]